MNKIPISNFVFPAVTELSKISIKLHDFYNRNPLSLSTQSSILTRQSSVGSISNQSPFSFPYRFNFLRFSLFNNSFNIFYVVRAVLQNFTLFMLDLSSLITLLTFALFSSHGPHASVFAFKPLFTKSELFKVFF